MHVIGGSNDGAGDAQNGFICRGGRMLNEETYENFWDLYIQDVIFFLISQDKTGINSQSM